MISVSDSLLSLGSPPLVRVKLSSFKSLIVSIRITPARAGKISTLAVLSKSV